MCGCGVLCGYLLVLFLFYHAYMNCAAIVKL